MKYVIAMFQGYKLTQKSTTYCEDLSSDGVIMDTGQGES